MRIRRLSAFLLVLAGVAVSAANKPEREQWFMDQALGMFVHWSVDSQLVASLRKFGIAVGFYFSPDDFCGLHLSVMRAQRIYNNTQWPNPIVVKIVDAQPVR